MQRNFAEGSDMPKVQCHPSVLWVGVGCERDTDKALIELAITKTCQENHLALGAIAGIATLDLKSDEVGLLELTQEKDWPLTCFTPEALKLIEVPTPSNVVEKEVGTPSVAEAAAIAATNTADPSSLKVKKQIVKKEGLKGAVTVAIAQSTTEYIGHTGKLHLVGTGPGSLSKITPAAKAAITQADVDNGSAL